MTDVAGSASHEEWPHGGGDTGARARAFDWGTTPLGPIDTWRQSLRTVVDLVLHSSIPMMLLWGRDGILIYNDAYAKIAGPCHPRVFGGSILTGWPEVADFYRGVIDAGLRGEGRSFRDQHLRMSRGGTPEDVWLNLDFSPAYDKFGEPIGVVGIVIDTTERVRTEAALRANEERLRLIADTLPALIRFVDKDEIVRFANRYYEHGIPSRDAVGRKLREVMGEEAYAARKPYIDRALAGEKVTFEAVNTWYDDRPREREIHYIPAVQDGEVIGFYAFVMDITASKRAETSLRQLFERSPSFMAIMRGPEHIFEFVNPAYQQLIGQRDVVGKPLHEALPDIAGQGFYELLDQVYQTRESYVGRTVPALLQRAPDAAKELRYIDFVLYPLPGIRGDETSVFLHGYEVTDRVNAERALRDLNETLEAQVDDRTRDLAHTLERLQNEIRERERAEEALRHSQKMEAVGQLTGGIAHDFNNLLQGILGSLGLIAKRIDQGRAAEATRFIGAANAAANRAAALIHRLLAFSRRQPLDPRPVDVNELVSSIEELLRRAAGESIIIDLSLTSEPWRTRCDPNQLENAILNLAINARDAMPSGGQLTIATRNVAVGDSEAQRHDVPPGEYVAVHVRDTGTGMPAEVRSRAFDPFFTTKPSGQGTGLGLSMVYGFARQSGGTTTIESAPGQGTTVCIFLPRFTGPATQDAVDVAIPAEAQVAPHGETVLVVEDEGIVRSLAVDVLREQGYRVLEAEDGKSALEQVERAGRLDLMITDLGLPGGMSGRQLVDAARLKRPEMKVLFMTGYADTAADTSAFLGAGMHLLTKPFPMDAFAARVREIIEGRPGVFPRPNS
jgi:PAS domain S-box-containing protein